MRGYGLQITERVALQPEEQRHNEAYLRTKRDRLGHDLELRAEKPAADSGKGPQTGPERQDS
jgi:3,4-dihydroxy 2-butanone 4-phosphate synthase/GTP cyclohydrolase II